MSIFADTRLSTELYTPRWRADSGAIVQDDLHDSMTAFSKTESASLGYDTASFTINIDGSGIDQWLNRVGYDFQLYSGSQQLLWQGFINDITINARSLSLRLGPLMNIGNSVRVEYQGVSYATDPPIPGSAQVTGSLDDAQSQENYSVLETHVSGGTGYEDDMLSLRDTYLEEYKNPETSQQLNLNGSQGVSITVSLLGYGHLLSRFYFLQNGTTTQAADVKIKAILDAHPSILFDTNGIEANALLVPVYSEGVDTGMAEINNIVSFGDANDSRYQFGIYGAVSTGKLEAVYRVIPTAESDVYYNYTLSDFGEAIEVINGGVAESWSVEAGRWLDMLNFLTGFTNNTEDMRDDPRKVYIESCTYTAPNSLSIVGGKVDTLAQKIAKTGLGGM